MSQEHTILVVDDTEENIAIMLELLSDHDVLVATDGQTALDTVKEEKVDLVLLDIIMPGMDGFAVIEKLKSDPETQYIPVVFITGLDTADNEEYGFELGAADYIYKPFNSAVVRARVATQLKLVDLYQECKSLKQQLSSKD